VGAPGQQIYAKIATGGIANLGKPKLFAEGSASPVVGFHHKGNRKMNLPERQNKRELQNYASKPVFELGPFWFR